MLIAVPDDYICTCQPTGAGTEAKNHDTWCLLMLDDDFRHGLCDWDQGSSNFIYPVLDDLDDECVDRDCPLPRPHDLRAHDIAGNEIDEAESSDILADVLTMVKGDDWSADEYDKCANYITPDVLRIFNLLAVTKDELDLVDIDILENWGPALTTGAKADMPPFYDCIHAKQPEKACPSCGVLRSKAGPWVPDENRRYSEIEMWLTGDFYQCDCTGKKKPKFACSKCRVQRWSQDASWTYWDPDAETYDLDTTDPRKSGGTTQTTVGSNQSSFDLADDWGEFAGFTGWGTNISTGTTKVFSKCRHYGEIVSLPDGTKIMCSSQHKRQPDEPKPDFGCYMAAGWEPDWLAYWLNWSDYGYPNMSKDTIEVLIDDLLAKARSGMTVEIGCIGGHGRTGSLLALLALKAGAADADAAMKFVWKNYCGHAIEGTKQEWFIEAFDARLKGLPEPPAPFTPHTRYEHERMFKENKRCTEPRCKDEAEHFKKWTEEEDAKSKKAAEAAKNTPPKLPATSGQATSKHVPQAVPLMAPQTFPSISDPIDWNTPVPDRDQARAWCSTWRHRVMHWRRETCNCTYWSADIKRFSARPDLAICDLGEKIERDIKQMESQLDAADAALIAAAQADAEQQTTPPVLI